MGHALIDPIAHAWRHCNPHAPLPSALASRGALSLYSSHGQRWSWSTQDTQNGLLTVAALPVISAPTGE